MFERIRAGAARAAERRARDVTVRLAEQAGGRLPKGIRAEAGPEGLLISGRSLRRRFVTDASLRDLLMEIWR